VAEGFNAVFLKRSHAQKVIAAPVTGTIFLSYLSVTLPSLAIRRNQVAHVYI
jgi:hypothetical protein